MDKDERDMDARKCTDECLLAYAEGKGGLLDVLKSKRKGLRRRVMGGMGASGVGVNSAL